VAVWLYAKTAIIDDGDDGIPTSPPGAVLYFCQSFLIRYENTMTISAPSARRLILLVDDDPVLLEFLSTVLQHAGHDIVTAGSAPEALQRIAEAEGSSEIALALLDINMPGMSGLDLARRLREHTQVPFMFLSSVDDAETARQAASHGAVGFLVKPVDAGRLVTAFESALARADEIRQLRRTEANLNAALAAGRETSLAVGLLMARYQTDRNTAFEVLRDHARASRRKVNEVAEQLVAAEELLNSLHVGFAARLRGK
jgi:CheY-like chemotaxis protein